MSRNAARTLLCWIVAALALFPFQRRLDHQLRAASPISGTESAAVERRLLDDFDSPFATNAVLVISGLTPTADTDAWRATIRRIVTPIAANRAVTALISPASSLDSMLASRDLTVAIAVVGIPRDAPAAIDSLRALTTAMQTAMRPDAPRLTLQWTGEPALLADLRAADVHAVHLGELRAVPATAVVALWAFGLAGAAWAFAGAALVITITLGMLGALAGLIPPTLLVQVLVPLVGLALTIDYSLYLVRRSREGAPHALLDRTVALAGLVAALGFAGLGFGPSGELRAAAAGGLIVALLSALAAVTLAPVTAHRPAGPVRGSSAWHRWGAVVVRHPWAVLASGAIPLGLVAWHASTARLTTPLDRWLPATMESSRALATLRSVDRAAAAAVIRVLVDYPPNVPVMSPRGWDGLARMSRALRALPAAGDVHSLATIGTGDRIVAADVLPRMVQQTYVSRNGRTAVVDVIPDVTRGTDGATALVRVIRGIDAASITGVPGSRISAAGLPAYAIDYETAVRRALPVVIVGIATATFIVLLLTFRAPVIALKAVTLNLLVATSAIGATVLVFQDGFGAQLFGERAMGSVFPQVPLLAFCATFGISMDYELFLVSGVLEAMRDGLAGDAAIIEGVGRTGGLITRAALIMATLFLAFATSNLLPLAMIGFTLAVAVILDATVVRLCLAPALLRIAGRWNWWPGRPGAPPSGPATGETVP